MVTSYCPDGVIASDLVLESAAVLRVFYDLDAPITLARLREGSPVDYIGPRGLRDFDLVLSFTGGAALGELKRQLGARRIAPLYGCVDPSVHRPVPPEDRFRADLSYLGTYSRDRDLGLRQLFAEAAKRLPSRRFMLGGSLYDSNFPWSDNIHFCSHIPAADHAAFYCSSLLTLNVTRKPMADMGYCPSGRLFEAAACGAPLLSDWWDGLNRFFEPGSERLVAHDTDAVLAALDRPPEELRAISRAARDRALAEHTADVRAGELERILGGSQQPVAESAMKMS